MTVIVGGGASGMVAALFVKKLSPKAKVKVFERMDRVGKKLLATGNGCCNFTNINMKSENFHSLDINIAWSIIKSFPPESVMEFFKAMGILNSIGEEGRVYPYSYQASAVLDCLRHTLTENGIEIITGVEITRIEKRNGIFNLLGKDNQSHTAKQVIITCGGASYKSLGSNGSGFELLKAMGHTITKLSPALTQLKTETNKIKGLDGIKVTARLSVIRSGKNDGDILFSQTGDVLFTSYGLSGPPALSASSLLHEYTGISLTASLDFMPDYDITKITEILRERAKTLSQLPMEDFFTGMLNKRLGMLIIKLSGIEKLSQKAESLTDAHIKRLAQSIKDYKIKITGTKGFETAQVTAGGAVLSEFNPVTLESKIVKGLYAAGEVLDVYGDCGGYNLHWAWASGRSAGIAAAGTGV